MVKKLTGVWGIDIGQSALKALRCRKEGGQVIAEAFDFIEYPKILSQPEANPETLVREALETFLSRNDIKGDKIAMSVPGQSGLAKFFKPPPVDAKKIPDIVRYEAKQQIPFPLEEVIWDFQQMAGGQIVEGFALDTEVGLFAMKREQVYKFLKPFDAADVEVDIIQLAPLSIYNFVSHDLMKDGPSPDLFDADSPPDSLVILSVGTDATDLIVTNGFRVWQRSIPIGGNHFTRQLTKELKLTFAKAEHLKRNARQAEDPKSVFQAMRPIFNDLVTEVQRSIGYFQGLDRKAQLKGVVLLGNTVKLPGLTQYLAKNLGYDVVNFDSFTEMTGGAVVDSPTFKDNLYSYGVCYGLCLQGLGDGRLSTNLLPQEIRTHRMVRAKKPWAVAGVGALMLACSFNFFFTYNVWSKVQDNRVTQNVSWKNAVEKVESAQTLSTGHESTHAEKDGRLKFLNQVGQELAGNADRRLLWLEVMKAINECLPVTPLPPDAITDFKKVPLDERRELYISYVETEYFQKLETWFPEIKGKYIELKRHLAARASGKALPVPAPTAASGIPAPANAAPATVAASGGTTTPVATTPVAVAATPGAGAAGSVSSEGVDAQSITGPTGKGWVVELHGYHYFNKGRNGAAVHIRDTILRKLEDGSVLLTIEPGKPPVPFTMKELGIGYPVLVLEEVPRPTQVPNPEYEGPDLGSGGLANMQGLSGPPGLSDNGAEGGGLSGAPGFGGETTKKDAKSDIPPVFNVSKYTFTIQFCWVETGLSERIAKRIEQHRLNAAAVATTAGTVPTSNAATVPPAANAAEGAVAPTAAVPAASSPAAVQPAPAEPAATDPSVPGSATGVTPAASGPPDPDPNGATTPTNGDPANTGLNSATGKAGI